MSRVESDVVAALILQNARITERVDLFRWFRTPKREVALLMFGKVVCALGALGSALEEEPNYFYVIGFAAGFLVFYWINPMRQWVFAWTDRRIAKRVKANLKEVRSNLPAVVTYDLEDTTLISIWSRGDEELSKRRVDLSQLAYGIIAEQSIVLFRSNCAVKSQLVLFSVQPALVEMLREYGVQLEMFSENLFPQPLAKRGASVCGIKYDET